MSQWTFFRQLIFHLRAKNRFLFGFAIGKILGQRDQVEQFHRILSGYERVGIAFSGGVDSSFLLKSALDVLGPNHVVVVHGRSCLQTQEEQQRAATWLSRHGYCPPIEQLFIDLQPLSWQGFAENKHDRCYLCKSRMYAIFLQKLALKGISFLLDGTNADDLKQDRPGLQAILELGVQTPLAAAGLCKAQIRRMSKKLNLDTSDQPSSSCLATRLPYGLIITGEHLAKIAFWEAGLARFGFLGCRVRMDLICDNGVYLQVIKEDVDRLATPDMQAEVRRFFQSCGIEHVHINPKGR